jgi:hypothetical protein
LPAQQQLTVASNVLSLGFTATASSTPTNWLAVTPTSGVVNSLLSVTVTPTSDLAPGIYTGRITVEIPSAPDQTRSIDVKLTVQAGKRTSTSKVVVPLFIGAVQSGNVNTPTNGDGLKALLRRINTDTVLKDVTIGKVFAHNDFRDAIGFVTSNVQSLDDRLILVGHSYGGETARQMAESFGKSYFAVSKQPLTVSALIVIDPIDPKLISFSQPLTDQRGVVKPRPKGVDFVLGFFQRLFDPSRGQVPGLSLYGYRIQDPDSEYEYDTPHAEIDADPRVLERIIELLHRVVNEM